MSQLTLDLHHTLGKDEVIRRVKDEIEKLRSSVASLQDQWEDNVLAFSAEAMGMKISGSLEIEETIVRIKVDLPMAAFMFKGMIEKRIRDELGGLLK
jgi:hypothetical protein